MGHPHAFRAALAVFNRILFIPDPSSGRLGGSDGDSACEQRNVAATEITQRFAKAINAHDTNGLRKRCPATMYWLIRSGTGFRLPPCELDGNNISRWCPTLGSRLMKSSQKGMRSFSLASPERRLSQGRDDETRKRMGGSGGAASTAKEGRIAEWRVYSTTSR